MKLTEKIKYVGVPMNFTTLNKNRTYEVTRSSLNCSDHFTQRSKDIFDGFYILNISRSYTFDTADGTSEEKIPYLTIMDPYVKLIKTLGLNIEITNGDKDMRIVGKNTIHNFLAFRLARYFRDKQHYRILEDIAEMIDSGVKGWTALMIGHDLHSAWFSKNRSWSFSHGYDAIQTYAYTRQVRDPKNNKKIITIRTLLLPYQNTEEFLTGATGRDGGGRAHGYHKTFKILAPDVRGFDWRTTPSSDYDFIHYIPGLSRFQIRVKRYENYLKKEEYYKAAKYLEYLAKKH